MVGQLLGRAVYFPPILVSPFRVRSDRSTCAVVEDLEKNAFGFSCQVEFSAQGQFRFLTLVGETLCG